MSPRPISLIIAAALLIMIGVSGMAAGGGVLGVALNGDAPADVRQGGLVIGALIAGYGFATVLAGVGLVLFRRWAWGIGLFATVVGLVAISGATVGIGAMDPALGLGVVIWGLTLVCLILPSTRAALSG